MFVDDKVIAEPPAMHVPAEPAAAMSGHPLWSGIQYCFADGYTYAHLDRRGCHFEACGKTPEEARARLASMLIQHASRKSP